MSSLCSSFLHLYRAVSLFPLISSALAEFGIANLGKQFIENLQAGFGPRHKDKSSSAALVLVLSTGPDPVEVSEQFHEKQGCSERYRLHCLSAHAVRQIFTDVNIKFQNILAICRKLIL